jgi:hypothetical protein
LIRWAVIGADMRRRDFITFIGGAAVVWPLAARAQENRPARIGVLVLTNADAQSLTLALREGLRTFGYSEGPLSKLDPRPATRNDCLGLLRSSYAYRLT